MEIRSGMAPVLCPNEFSRLPDSGRIATQVAVEGRARVGRNTGGSMSGHWRFCVAAFLLAAALSTSPASSNPFDALFNSAPTEVAAPAAAAEECLPQPGKSTAPGQHWVYRLDGHRKCWFQAAEGAVSVKKPARHHAAKQPVIAPEEHEAGLRKKAVVDARAQLLRSDPAEALEPTPPAPEVVDADPTPVDGAAALALPAPVVAEPTVDQRTPDQPAPVDVERLLAKMPFAGDAVVSPAPSAPAGAPSIREAGADEWEWMASRAGAVLIALGLVSLLGSLLAGLFLNSRVGSIRQTWSVQTAPEA